MIRLSLSQHPVDDSQQLRGRRNNRLMAPFLPRQPVVEQAEPPVGLFPDVDSSALTEYPSQIRAPGLGDPAASLALNTKCGCVASTTEEFEQRLRTSPIGNLRNDL